MIHNLNLLVNQQYSSITAGANKSKTILHCLRYGNTEICLLRVTDVGLNYDSYGDNHKRNA